MRIDELNRGPFTEEQQLEENELQKQIEDLMRMEEMYQHQRSRVNWLNYGDLNTKFFHVSTIQRRQRNQLLKMKDNDSRWVEGNDKVTELVLGYFRGPFQSSNQSIPNWLSNSIQPKVAAVVNDRLCGPVSDEEIYNAAFSLGATKAPGPDGEVGFFYHRYWDIIGDRRMFVMPSGIFLLLANCMPYLVNCTKIVLIPKINDPDCISHYRPISLCNFIYKIISKILVLRLKPWIAGLISDQQVAFVPVRSVQDNIIIAHEAYPGLLNLKKGKNFNIAIKLTCKNSLPMGWNGVFLELLWRDWGSVMFGLIG